MPPRPWQLAISPTGLATPADLQVLPALQWLDAPTGGSVAQILKNAGLWNDQAAETLAHSDCWYRCQLPAQSARQLCFEGIAGAAEIWLDTQLLARHTTMYRPLQVSLPSIGEEGAMLYVCLRTQQSWAQKRQGRARWRPRMVQPGSMREVRQTLLGHMPGWCPEVPALGLYGAVSVVSAEASADPRVVRLVADWTHDGAVLDLALDWTGTVPGIIHVAGQQLALVRDDAGHWVAQGAIASASPWWPHTHGPATLYALEMEVPGQRWTLGEIGFRRIEFDPQASHNGFRVNGQAVFCRGVCWTPPDLFALWSDQPTYRKYIRAIADAGMNMVRVGGTMLYEHADFFAACDRAGVLVWHDFMLANFDYPSRDPAFMAELQAEAQHFLTRTATHPCLAVLCGGSEVRQQAEMLGAPWPADEPIFETLLRQQSAAVRPDVAYVANTPWGGANSFSTRQGLTHYYGVGAYLRPLEDARRAAVGFTPECMALAHVPSESQLGTALSSQPGDRHWKRATPRDLGAGWDFDDVRDHYVQRLYEVDPARLRYEDPARYLDLGRAVSCDLAESLFSEWRRPGSGCAGALIWQLRDLRAGSGWGLWDHLGNFKPVWHALRERLQPVQLLLTDEGLDGLDLHVINESTELLQTELVLTSLRDGERVVAEGSIALELPPGYAGTVQSSAVLGRFFDITYAYRFGPPSHDVTIAVLRDQRTGAVLSQAVHTPRRNLQRADLGLQAQTELCDGVLWMTVSTRRFAQYVHFSSTTHALEADWFHLAPGASRRLRLIPIPGHADVDPALAGGALSALNAQSSSWVRMGAC